MQLVPILVNHRSHASYTIVRLLTLLLAENLFRQKKHVVLNLCSSQSLITWSLDFIALISQMHSIERGVTFTQLCICKYTYVFQII